MTSTNHQTDRELQADARAWAKFTGVSYTTSLRQLTAPEAQGLLGPRLSARHLIRTLTEHPIVGSREEVPVLREHGITVPGQNDMGRAWSFGGRVDFAQLALISDVLRMFSPVSDGTKPAVGSYSAKHFAENFLNGIVSYVSNGRLIWAAAALGLPLGPREVGSPNIKIGLPKLEYDYARRSVGHGHTRPKADQHRPPGFEALSLRVKQLVAGDAVAPRQVPVASAPVESAFSAWLVDQAGLDTAIGDLARDYSAGIDSSEHRIAESPEDLLAILDDVGCIPRVYELAQEAGAEWRATA
ncbi:hypothetical protein SAMN06295974_3714 [Plantibacter flavus]|uniref:Uncharacterized protein n=1 Tax=Plantibacter flavus TaxID=150123 RepID=A0A3N2BLQ8_9MICO|nr:hypothetical protein [Plantibacter flavus]ROR76138.1 hypothetical protein EDD42_4091 [Plantibacter flavus]SMG48324.1 hypothetical protein SAMN06295974_3714 [Plantibacter flavus]